MAARNVYHVTYNKSNGNWHVTQSGSTLATRETKDAAVSRGREIALAHQPSQLVVHKMNGEIETEYTYGGDPYPPKG